MKLPITDAKSLKIGIPVPVINDLLRLDKHNPRLVDSAISQGGDDAIILSLYQSGELKELIQSISANGYLDFEPLVVILTEDNNALIVLEGNRRLAAIKLLSDPERAKKLNIPVPEISKEILASFEAVRVIRVEDRIAARPFIAFKHINGPHRWDSYAKAKFAAEWFQNEKNRLGDDASLTAIAESIGDSHDTIKRMVAAIYVLEQAKEAALFSVEDRFHPKFNFSHLYTALSRSEYMRHLGLGEKWRTFDPEPNPVPVEKLKELKEVLIWIYGSAPDKVEPVVRSQNPDIKRLARVLAQTKAIHVLRSSQNLDEAHGESIPISEKFADALVMADDFVKVALGNLRAYEGDDLSLLDIAANIRENAETLHVRMSSKSVSKPDSKSDE